MRHEACREGATPLVMARRGGVSVDITKELVASCAVCARDGCVRPLRGSLIDCVDYFGDAGGCENGIATSIVVGAVVVYCQVG